MDRRTRVSKKILAAMHSPKEIGALLQQSLAPTLKALKMAPNSVGVVSQAQGDGTEVEVLLKHEDQTPLTTQEAQKLLQGVQYFLGEAEVTVGPFQPVSNGSILVAPVQSYPQFEDSDWSMVQNSAARQGLENGSILSVRDIGQEVEPGLFKLNKFVDGADYFDPETEQFIWTIGKDQDGEIYAAYDGRFWNDPEYETLFAR